MSSSARLAVPLLSSGQAAKETTVNEGLAILDAVVAACVEEPPRVSPPASPVPGNCYIVASGATGAWAGHAGKLAAYTEGGWRFIAPVSGLTAFVKSATTSIAYVGGAWELGSVRADRILVGGQQVVGARGTAIAAPSGGPTADAEARAAIGSILAALRLHGLIAT